MSLHFLQHVRDFSSPFSVWCKLIFLQDKSHWNGFDISCSQQEKMNEGNMALLHNKSTSHSPRAELLKIFYEWKCNFQIIWLVWRWCFYICLSVIANIRWAAQVTMAMHPDKERKNHHHRPENLKHKSCFIVLTSGVRETDHIQWWEAWYGDKNANSVNANVTNCKLFQKITWINNDKINLVSPLAHPQSSVLGTTAEHCVLCVHDKFTFQSGLPSLLCS